MRLSLGCCECGVEPLLVDYQRSVVCDGPIDDTSVAGYDTPWTWQAFRVLSGGSWQDTQYVWSYIHPSFPLADKLMQPVRFSTLSGSAFYGPAPNRRQLSDFTPPATADGHFSGSITSKLISTAGLFSVGNDTGSRSRLTHYRVLLDGVDQTGVVSLGANSRAFATLRPSRRFNGVWWSDAFEIPISLAISGAQRLSVDLWCEFKPGDPCSVGDAFSNDPFGPTIIGYAVVGCHGSRGGGLSGYMSALPVWTPGKINVHRRLTPSDTWSLVFTGGTVGGVSSLTMQSQSGWSFSRNGPVISMLKVSGTETGDRVTLRYDTETPDLYVQKYAMAVLEGDTLRRGVMRYGIESPSYYGPTPPAGRQFGPITATGANTFTANSRGQYPMESVWQPIEHTVASQLTGFPTSVTATRL